MKQFDIMPVICCIYKITNPKGRIYIGQTVNFFKREWLYNQAACKLQKKLYYSIKKYGWENHNMELVYICDEKSLNHWESYYVYFYDTFNTTHGLNIKDGGGSRGRASNKTRKKISKSNTGKKRTQEQLFSLKEDRKKWRVPVNKYDSGGEFIECYSGIREAASINKSTGGNTTGIIACCKFKRKTCAGFQWRYANECNKQNIGEVAPIQKNRKVIQQLTLGGVKIRQWDSVYHINRELGFNTGGIRQCCTGGNQVTANGYKLEYVIKNVPISKRGKPVTQLTLSGHEIITWDTALQAEQTLGYYGANISACCLGRSNTAYGFKWQYANNKTA